MAWTAPYTWSNDELVTADLLNTHLKDNLLALKDPPTDSHILNEASSDYTTSSTTYVDVDSDLTLQITTTGGDLLIGFFGAVFNSVSSPIFFDVHLKESLEAVGARIGGDDGLVVCRHDSNSEVIPVSFVYLREDLVAGTYTLKLQWKVGGNTATLYAGAGTSGRDVHPQFFVREV